MLLQRLAKSLKNQDWSTVAIEIIVLTSGIFLGLQAESWYQNRIDSASAQGYMERIGNDFAAIRDRATLSVAEMNREIDALLALSGMIDGDDSKSESDYRDLVVELSNYATPPTRAASYIDILESDSLGLLGDHSLADMLIRCDNQMQRFLSAHDVRKQLEIGQSQPLINLILDLEYLSFGDAIELADPESPAFRRALTISLLDRRLGKNGYDGIVECSTSIVDALAAKDRR
jgi:hypothetical protein